MVDVTLTADELERLRQDALLFPMSVALFRIEGPGALQCLQGIFTNDLAKPPVDALTYGALLTPRGLIILDCWILREAGSFLLITNAEAHDTVADIFRKQLPPRLARVTDLTGQWSAAALLGGAASGALKRATASGSLAPAVLAAPSATGARPPFVALLLGPDGPDLEHARKHLALAGVHTASGNQWEAARIVAGWPQYGAEIDEKTLVQEVRFDENNGVSYDKGCYTGQETVARLHFRGHTNRDLRGLVWTGVEPMINDRIIAGEKEVGSVRSSLTLPTERLGLALIRREVETGQVVTAGGLPATVVALPFPTL
jgi:folate-binding protein YgfZ